MPTGQKRRPTSDGCLPCRRRKKRCDLRKPTCQGCERNVLLCSWASVSSTRAGGRSTRFEESCSTSQFPNAPSRIFNRSPRTQCRQPSSVAARVLKSPLSSLLYQHWLERTGNTMSAQRGASNSFITVLPRLALNYPNTVLQSLLALSGVHYANRVPDGEVNVETWTHLGLALRALKHGLTAHATTQTAVDHVPLLTTTLVLCFVETTRGDQGAKLVHHLGAARFLLRQMLSSSDLPPIEEDVLEFLKEFYVYVESITRLTGSSTEYNMSAFPSEQSGDIYAISLSSKKSPGNLLGCSHELFNMIPEVQMVINEHRSQKLRGLNSSNNIVEQLHYKFQDLHTRISTWLPPPSTNSDFAVCGYMYQEAILCYLETTFISSYHCGDLITIRLLRFISLLTIIPLDAPISATLTWPLVVFGVLATDQSHRKAIYDRLACMWNLLDLRNIEVSMAFLRRLWMEKQINPDDGVGGNCAVETDLGSIMRKMSVDITFV